MKTRMLTAVALGVLVVWVLPCNGQEKAEKLLPPKERPQEKAVAAAPAAPCCGTKFLWVDYWVPVQTLYPREYVTKETCGTWTVKFREQEQVVTDMVVRPREITKEVTYCTTEPVTTTDSATGQSKTCMQQVTHTKLVKETIFEAVPEQRKLKVATPYLSPDTAEILHKYTIYEWKTDMVKRGCVVSMPGGEVANTANCVVGPKPPCLD